ncbi:hypothetical protein MKD41_13275 [Lutibacter sp. A64]|uniref:hypothetical protein n=1 Tax=Lutibacter sp. A64 TaxID=2918526 RepID=UPI001F065156|nr:hypothetical protein [Lutibacter sp. A64]UMB53299.1 hypothetical protein MKD41_13275 [Lutibacter sp. A64]
MKEKLSHKTIKTAFPILGLALLLLLLPCKVRNFIQAELGVQQTKVTNKGKTTINNTNCNNLEISTKNKVSHNSNTLQTTAVLTTTDFTLKLHLFYTKKIQLLKASTNSITTVPLYILYQNFKDYL